MQGQKLQAREPDTGFMLIRAMFPRMFLLDGKVSQAL